MAAVAGSKGRIDPMDANEDGTQLILLRALLEGGICPEDAARRLLAHARIREVGIDTNMICNLACAYCYLGDRREEGGTVPLEALEERLACLVDSGAKLLAFIGKEPLADNRAVSLMMRLNALRQCGVRFRTGMVTNGTLVLRRLEELIEAEPSYLDVSIDGISDRENRLRGSGVTARILKSIKAIVDSPLRARFATATVLSEASLPRYADFAATMFDMGVPTCFASPVLQFALSKEVAAEAVDLERTLDLCEQLATVADRAGADAQVIIDLPYRYTWSMIRSGYCSVDDIREDHNEALYWQAPGSRVFVKLNPFTYSYWRALRITHDGRVLLNMDLAAHAQYAEASIELEQIDETLLNRVRHEGLPILTEFIARHCAITRSDLYLRDLQGQFERNRAQLAA